MVKKLSLVGHKNKANTGHHAVVGQLSELLANTYGLYLKTQNYHWNVTGPQFIMLHLFFEEQYKELAEATDLIAERIRALHAHTPATFAEFNELMSLSESKKTISSATMLSNLAHDHQFIIKLLKQFAESKDIQHDLATQDIYIERLRAHEKTLWMIQSHLE